MSTTGKQIKSPGQLTPLATAIPSNLPKFPKFKSQTDIKRRIDIYLSKYTAATNLYPNFAGLALFLGFREEKEMYDYKETAPITVRDELKRGLLKVHELICAAALRGNIGAIFMLKARGGSPAIAMVYQEKSVLEIETPAGLSKEDSERLRRVSDLWEKERRRELAGKVQEIKKASL